MRKKDNLFAFRVNDEDAKKIRANIQKSGLTMNEYLSTVCLKGQVVNKIDALKFKVFHDELLRQGNNLNQIAHQLNSGKHATTGFTELANKYNELIHAYNESRIK